MTAQTDSNLMERLKRAVYPTDPNSPDGDWNIRTSAGSGGTSTTDNTAFTPGSSSVTPAAGYYGGRSVGSGHVAAMAINGSGVLQVDIISGAVGQATVNINGIPTVNMGLWGKVPTMFLIKATSAGVTLLASGLFPFNVYGVKLITDATVDVYFQSASGNAIEGTMRLLPGAGFAENTQIGHPLYIAPSGLFIALSGAANVGGIVRGYN